jgi:5-methylcytosine-specific restriction endonuclease McrA
MRYHYVSPACRQWVWIDWEIRHGAIHCPHLDVTYRAPGPAEQVDAYVDTHEWPEEMEDIVRRLRGDRCTVPGCSRYADTLDHRTPWSQGGHTCVANLWPMCSDHNTSKSDTDYVVWLAAERLRQARRLLR